MASHVQTVTRQTVTRRWADIDPKMIAVGIVALVAIAVVAALWITGSVTAIEFWGTSGSLLLTWLAGYVKKSSHGELIEKAVEDAKDLADAVEPIVAEVAPQAAPVAAEVQEAVDELAAAFGGSPTAR